MVIEEGVTEAVTPPTRHKMSVPTPTDVAQNAAILVALWATYAVVRSLTADTATTAVANATQLLEFQTRIGIDIESGVQQMISWPAALIAANFYYLVHFPVTVMALVATFLQDRERSYVVLRNGLILVTGIALAVHLAMPLAPPRMLPGFIDTGALFGPDPYALPGSDGANQYAAMPSMHVAWAILAGHAFWRLNHVRGIRAVAIAHPAMTAVVVIVTGHHFVTDVVIGALLAALALVVHRYRAG